MSIRSREYNMIAAVVILVICVSYLGTGGLYNADIINYSAHSESSLGESRGIDAGTRDMLMPDSSAGLLLQTRTIRTRESEPSMEDAGVLAAVLACLLLSLLFCIYTAVYRHADIRNSHRWVMLDYIHKKDGKKRHFTGVLTSLYE